MSVSHDEMSIPATLITHFCASLGYDPKRVQSISITPMEVTIVTMLFDRDGKNVIDEGYIAKVKTETHRHWIAT